MDYPTIHELSQKLVGIGFVLTLLEWAGTRFLIPVIGTVGIPILRTRLPAKPELHLPTGPGIRSIGGIRVRPAGVGARHYFSSMSKTSFFSIHTPCPLKCSLRYLRESQQLELIGRFPIGFGIFIAGWIAPFVAARDSGLAVIGSLFFVACVVTEYVRAQARGEELVRALNRSSQPAA